MTPSLSKQPSRIVVIQNKESQIDAPLFAILAKEPRVSLHVYYTDTKARRNSGFDKEASQMPTWDSIEGLTYPHSYTGSIVQIFRNVRSFCPDLVLINGWYPRSHIFLALLFRLSGLRVGSRFDHVESKYAIRFLNLLRSFYHKQMLKLATSWHPVGMASQAYALSVAGPCRPIVPIPYCVDIKWISARSKRTRQHIPEIRMTLGFNESHIIVVGALKWIFREDPLTLIEAFSNVRSRVPNLRLILMGDGPLRKEVARATMIFDNDVYLPGYVKYSKFIDLLSISNIFVHPARHEPFGVSIQEALAVGLKVIASDSVGSVNDFDANRKIIDIFPAGNPKELEKLIESACVLHSDEKKYHSAAGHFEYSKTLDQLTNWISDCP